MGREPFHRELIHNMECGGGGNSGQKYALSVDHEVIFGKQVDKR